MAMTTGRVQVKVTAKATTSAPRAIKPAAPAKWASGVLATTATLAQALPAAAAEPATTSVPVTAVPVDDINIDSGVEAVIGAVKTAGDLVKSGINAVDSGLQLLQQGYEAAAPSINQGIQTVSPVLQQAAKVTIDTATPAFKAALPALQEAQTSLNGALGGLLQDPNVSTVVSTGQQAATTATPLASRAFTFLSGQDPSTLAEYGLGAFAFLFLAPKLLGVLGGAFRGYAGDITAAQVLDTLNDSSSVLIDIRTLKEKESSGVPDVPSSFGGRLIEVELAVTEDKKLRNALRDPNSIEAAVTSLRIASLKRVGKGTKVLLLDRYGNIAKAVAKELASKGFGKVYTVEGGFDGRNGWVQSKLQIKPAATVISAPLPFLGTRGTKKALPSPKA